MIRYVKKTYYDNEHIQIVLKGKLQYGYSGKAIVENDELIGVTCNNNFYELSFVHAIAPADSPINLSMVVFKRHLLESSQSIADIGCPPEHQIEITTDMIEYTEYQRLLFESCYHNKNHLNHVNWFAPGACYYPKGCYDLGGTRSNTSDKIGARVDDSWQMWRLALKKNKWLGNITATEITYRGV